MALRKLVFLFVTKMIFLHVGMLQQFMLVLMWGPLFVGVPVRPNMLNMLKSVSDCVHYVKSSHVTIVNRT